MTLDRERWAAQVREYALWIEAGSIAPQLSPAQRIVEVREARAFAASIEQATGPVALRALAEQTTRATIRGMMLAYPDVFGSPEILDAIMADPERCARVLERIRLMSRQALDDDRRRLQ